ncbi:MAG TPA: DMT family transporter [Alphaproteobacteria bacterium]
MSDHPQLLPTFASVLATVLGGSAIVATRLAVGDGQPDPLAFSVLRYVGASAVMIAIAFATLGRRFRIIGPGLVPIMGLGVLQFALFGWLFTASLRYVPSARGGLIFATMPILTLGMAVLLGRERLTAAKIVGAALACGGVAFALGEGALATGPEVWKGDAMMFGAALAGSTYNVLSGIYLRNMAALGMVAIQLPVGAVVLLAVLVASGDLSGLVALSATEWGAAIYVATLGGAASFYLWIWALERIAPSRVAVTVTFNPVSAALLGAFVLGEPLTWRMLAGLAGIVAGIAIANWPVRQPAPASG